MAFSDTYFAKIDNAYSINSRQLFSYKSSTDALATIVASGYFNSITAKLRKDDVLFIAGSDADDIYKVTSATGAATVTVGILVDGSNLGAGVVELANLATGIAPAGVCKYHDVFTTLGGAAIETITATGVLSTDTVVATLQQAGSTPRTIVTAAAGDDSVIITFSGDPSTDHIVNFAVFRDAS